MSLRNCIEHHVVAKITRKSFPTLCIEPRLWQIACTYKRCNITTFLVMSGITPTGNDLLTSLTVFHSVSPPRSQTSYRSRCKNDSLLLCVQLIQLFAVTRYKCWCDIISVLTLLDSGTAPWSHDSAPGVKGERWCNLKGNVGVTGRQLDWSPEPTRETKGQNNPRPRQILRI